VERNSIGLSIAATLCSCVCLPVCRLGDFQILERWYIGPSTNTYPTHNLVGHKKYRVEQHGIWGPVKSPVTYRWKISPPVVGDTGNLLLLQIQVMSNSTILKSWCCKMISFDTNVGCFFLNKNLCKPTQEWLKIEWSSTGDFKASHQPALSSFFWLICLSSFKAQCSVTTTLRMTQSASNPVPVTNLETSFSK